jgi:hypothetical protein
MDDDILSTGELAERPRFRGGHRPAEESPAEPDVLLDVPQLQVEEIILDVEELRAHVSVQADVLNLLRLSIGADVEAGDVHLEIKGVDAQAVLKVRLDKVAEIINRVLTTIDRNPEILEYVVLPPAAATGQMARTAGRTVDEVASTVGSAAPDLDRAEITGEPVERGATTKKQTVAKAPRRESESAGAEEGTPRGPVRESESAGDEERTPRGPRRESESAGAKKLAARRPLHRRKQERSTEEPPP